MYKSNKPFGHLGDEMAHSFVRCRRAAAALLLAAAATVGPAVVAAQDPAAVRSILLAIEFGSSSEWGWEGYMPWGWEEKP